jgi:very-short-patch-repair endonuclease
MRVTNSEQFCLKSTIIHNNRYDYSLVKYVNNGIKVKIICPVHGEFPQRPRNHLQGQGCPFCNGKFRKTNEKFILDSKKIHGDKYDYSLVKYKNNKTNVKIICPIHGEFTQRPDDHLNGHGCQLCGGKKKKKLDIFIEQSNIIHNDFYNYDKTHYKNNWTNVIVTCPIHGDFNVTPNNHLSKKSGCSKCSESNGERDIRIYLEKNSIDFIYQHRFKNCRYKLSLPFDFYLPKHNICIEYDGIQHYESLTYFGGNERFHNQVIKDKIKNEYCQNNNIKLIRIKYTENINNILNSQLDFLFINSDLDLLKPNICLLK